MKKGRLYNKQEIQVISKSAIGKSINEIEKEELLSFEDTNINNKGSLGQLVENLLFGINTNSDSEPDFMPAGIELKVTPYKKLKDGKLSAKERLVLNIIDYMNEYKKDFKTSHFWFKNNTIQLLWYLWEPNKDIKDLKITHEKLFELAKSEDLKQIEADWNYIIDKIKDGKAHELSEADTMYLGACTKGANSSSLRQQPNSNIPAMQRAFCFKNSYMTQLVRKYIGDYSNVEKIIIDNSKTFFDYVIDVVNKYKGKSQKELLDIFNLNSKAKNINSMLVSRMFNIKGNLGDSEEFKKANIIPRTIRMEENGKIKESMPFPTFKYTEIVNETWDDSELKNTLEETKYMFFIFKKENGKYIFKNIKLWNMPELLIENEVKKVWNKTVDIIRNGNIVNLIDKNSVRYTNFPGMSENPICHVRPHALNANDTYDLPTPDKLTGDTKYTKHCFWINSKYLEEVLKDI